MGKDFLFLLPSSLSGFDSFLFSQDRRRGSSPYLAALHWIRLTIWINVGYETGISFISPSFLSVSRGLFPIYGDDTLIYYKLNLLDGVLNRRHHVNVDMFNRNLPQMRNNVGVGYLGAAAYFFILHV